MYELFEALSIDCDGEKITVYLDEASYNSYCFYTSITGKNKPKPERVVLADILETLLGYYGEKYGAYPYYVPGHKKEE